MTRPLRQDVDYWTWRDATFYATGVEHSPTSATGTAWERTPWYATQRAAWAALRVESEKVTEARERDPK
jgi:hypothetical protein